MLWSVFLYLWSRNEIQTSYLSLTEDKSKLGCGVFWVLAHPHSLSIAGSLWINSALPPRSTFPSSLCFSRTCYKVHLCFPVSEMPFSVLSLTPHPLHISSHARTILSSFSLTEFSTGLNFFPLQSYKLESSNGCLGVFSTLPVVIDKNTVVFDGSGL